MVQASRPIYRNIRRASTQLPRRCERRARVHLAKVEHVREDGAVLDAVEAVDPRFHACLVLVLGRDPGGAGGALV